MVYMTGTAFSEAGKQSITKTTTQKIDVLFIIGDWNAKVGSQEISGKQGNLALEYRM